MNFNLVVAEVSRMCMRPDKAVDAAAAVNRAVRFCSIKGDFRKDLVEASISVDATLYGATISLSSLTRLRKFTYIKPTGVKYYLTPLAEDKIFTPKNNLQTDKYYRAGTNLTYTLSALTPSLEVGYLRYPPVLAGTDTHWMLEDMPEAIIDLAVARMFQLIGDDASALRYERSGMELFLAMRGDLALED